MNRRICLIGLVLMLLCTVCTCAGAEELTALDTGYENVRFSNGYFGYCIDRKKSGAYTNDVFSAADSTAAALSNVDNTDISRPLKVLFTQCFEDVFASDGSGGYQIKNPNTILGVVYHFSENQYVWGEQKTLVDKVKAYQGADIPDHGYQLQLSSGETVTFDFMVIIPQNADQQYFFAYKIDASAEHTCAGEKVTGQAANCVTPGWKDYYRCSCGKYYTDQACTQEIADLAAWKEGEGKTTAEHEFDAYVNTDAEEHWQECVCGEKQNIGVHVYNNAQDTTCNTCGHVRTVAAPPVLPKTGDDSMPVMWAMLLVINLAGFIWLRSKAFG